MSQIDTFEKFVAAYEESDYDIDSMDFSSSEYEAIKQSILAFGDEPMKNADNVLQEYYAMKVPSSIIKEILSENFVLAYEVYTNGVRDTCQREIISDSVLRHIGVRDWPTYGEGEQVMRDFVKELKEKAKNFNIEFIVDIEEAV